MSADALYALACQQLQAGDYAHAEASLREALSYAPQHAPALGNLGYVLERRGADAQAEAAYRAGLAADPGLTEIEVNLGALLMRARRLDEAELALRHAVTQRPDSATAWSNLGACLACMQRETEAEVCDRKALALDPQRRSARFNLSYLLLRQERYEEGWAMFEARDWYGALARQLPLPRWQGESLAGKRVLLTFEPGHGDMVFFLRYAPMVKARGAAHVTLICHPGLQTLFTGAEGIDQVIAINAPFEAAAHDLWTPLASLPHHCGTRAGNLPAALPYLRADPAHVSAWATRLAALPHPRIGLVWRGNPRFENDADRSLPALSTLAPLLALAGISFISLQKGEGESDAAAEPRLTALGTQLHDFADTAAVIMHLDLVISVDTAVAHLAGALGCTCWLLLPDYKADWRWGRERQDTPWYPGVMRLFRQPRAGTWAPVVESVTMELTRWLAALPLV